MRKQHELPCEICGKEGNTVGAHQRLEGSGGTGFKPSDNLTIPLCHEHHDQEHRGWFTFWSTLVTGAPALLKRLLLARAREIYRAHFPDPGEIVLIDALQHYVRESKDHTGAKALSALNEFQRMYPEKNLYWRP